MELVPPDLKVNKDYYVDVLSRLVQRIRGVSPQLQGTGSRFLSHDNETSHCSITTAIFGKTRDSRFKSPRNILLIYPHLLLIPQNQTHAERELILRHGEH
jgi:hypothetical protein